MSNFKKNDAAVLQESLGSLAVKSGIGILVAASVLAALPANSASLVGVDGANPFQSVSLTSGYQLSCSDTSDKDMEGKCGEGKCGEGKCGEGMCGGK